MKVMPRITSLVLALFIMLTPACTLRYARVNPVHHKTQWGGGPAESAVLVNDMPIDDSKPTIAIIKKGKEAPFDGVLYNDAAYADQRAKRERERELAGLQAKHDLDIQRIRLKAATSTTQVSLDACKSEKTRVYDVKDDRIKFLEKQLVDADGGSAWWENALWFGLGAAAVLGGAWAISEVNDRD